MCSKIANWPTEYHLTWSCPVSSGTHLFHYLASWLLFVISHYNGGHLYTHSHYSYYSVHVPWCSVWAFAKQSQCSNLECKYIPQVVLHGGNGKHIMYRSLILNQLGVEHWHFVVTHLHVCAWLNTDFTQETNNNCVPQVSSLEMQTGNSLWDLP